jgi:hypothetical protein
MAVAELPEDLPDASGSGISSHVWRGGDGQLNPQAQGVADVVACGRGVISQREKMVILQRGI